MRRLLNLALQHSRSTGTLYSYSKKEAGSSIGAKGRFYCSPRRSCKAFDPLGCIERVSIYSALALLKLCFLQLATQISRASATLGDSVYSDGMLLLTCSQT